MDTLEQFREETRQWLKANAPQSMYAPLRSTDDACWGGRKTVYPPDVKRWMLWASLALGAVVLGWMAWRLSRELAATPERGDADSTRD